MAALRRKPLSSRRDKKDELPKMQVSFIDTICLPIYDAFAKLFPDVLKPLYDGVVANRGHWIALAQEQSKLRAWAEQESGKILKESEKRKKSARDALRHRQNTTS